MQRDGGAARIRPAHDVADYARFADLCRAYLQWCRERYRALPWFVEDVFGHQSLDAELAKLPTKYGPPNGLTLLGTLDGEIVAAGAYHRLGDDICELKRLFVSNRARGTGLGRKLTDALAAAAKADGYAAIRLDSATLFVEAIALYESAGFHRIAPYLPYPDRLMPHLVFMERRL
jgi:ribosomal protein S18 acetylase RimI-like enzyme